MTRVVRLLVVLAVAAALRVEVAQSRSGEGWQLVVEEHLARYPAMGAEGLYKLAHQATFGPAHLITDEAAAKNYLVSELGGVAADDSEPLVETLAADPPLVRVNLRPFKARRGDPARLLAALLTTANTVKGDPTTMRARLGLAVEALAAHGREAEAERLRRLATELGAQGFPAVHHSQAYTDAYKPAYRVVRRDLVVVP
ncbi:MAG: hypothetical protein GX464_03940 [Holophagae bacterium]|nr:hypothetical protein [Holophagae bacterium]